MTKFGIGQAVPRIEDPRLLTGRGRYTDDLRLGGEAHLHVLRSPHAHAVVKAVRAEAAASAPGVLLVLTGEDVARDGIGPIPCLADIGRPVAATPRPVLATDRVRHVGQPVAVVVAETLLQARDAAELIEVDYEPLPAVTDTIGATREGAPQIWDSAPRNIAFEWERGDRRAVDVAFAGAARTCRIEVVNNRLIVNAMEPRGAIGLVDNGRITLHCGAQGTHLIRDQLAEHILKVPVEQVRVLTGDVGGGFGMKAFMFPEYVHVCWAARRLLRPVRWTADRSESFVSDGQGRDNVTTAELAMDEDGRFLALRVLNHGNMGAYHSNFAPLIVTAAGTSMFQGVYRTPAVHITVKGVVTNTLPVDAYRGAGRPEAIYALERLVDKAARETGIGPIELRRRNLIGKGELPFTTPLGETYDSGDFAGCMDEALERADWAGFDSRLAESRKRGRLRGIGLACYIETCGGAPAETAELRFSDGDVVAVHIGTQSNGQGHETAYAQVLSERLGIDVEQIRLIQGDSDVVAWGLTGGSRSVPVGGVAIQGAADEVIEKGRELAAHVLEAAAADITFSDGSFGVVGTDRSVTIWKLAELARDPASLPEGMPPGLDQTHQHTPPAPTYPNGCHIAEVEIDPDTGRIEIVRYVLVDDFGAVINPLLIAGQIHGGIVQGIGQALLEHTVYDDTGQLLSGSLMDYTLPRADHVPPLEIHYRHDPCTTNPLGIKGAGEAGSIAAPPAVMNAVVDALSRELGPVEIDMPATPLAVWERLQSRRAP
jgi:aerobic carbon-monoxide dehydrogenase large subunit